MKKKLHNFVIFMIFSQSTLDRMVAKLKVRKFDGLSSSRSGDIEENYRGAIMAPTILIRVKTTEKPTTLLQN